VKKVTDFVKRIKKEGNAKAVVRQQLHAEIDRQGREKREREA